MNNPGIYIITNKINGMQYVGKDSNLPNRSKIHLRGGKSGCPDIYDAIQEYGKENFDVEIIPYPGISNEGLNAVETWKIRQLGTKKPKGYNCTDGGEGVTGHKHSDESRRRISEGGKGLRRSAETRRRISEGRKGFRHTKETRKKLSELHKGKKRQPHSEETKRKISESNKGKTISAEHRRKLSEAHTGKTLSAEHRRKIGEAGKGKKRSAEAIRKTSEANRGRTHSEESKRKISESRKGKCMGNQHTKSKFPSKETRLKISQALSGENNPSYGKTPSDDIKRKIAKTLSETARRKKKKCYWMYILSLSRVWYEMYDAVMAQREEFFSKDIPNTSDAEQITLI